MADVDDAFERHVLRFTAPVTHLQMTKRMQGMIRDLAVASWRFDWRDRPGTVVAVDDHEGIPRLSITIPQTPDLHAATLQADVDVAVPAREQVRALLLGYVRSQLDAGLTFGSERPAAA